MRKKVENENVKTRCEWARDSLCVNNRITKQMIYRALVTHKLKYHRPAGTKCQLIERADIEAWIFGK